MSHPPSADDIFEAMAAASVGDRAARVSVPDDAPPEDPFTKLAVAFNVLLDDLAFQSAQSQSAHEAVRQDLERRAAMLANALDAIITIDHEGNVTEFNPAAEATFGYQASEVVGRQLADLIVPARLRQKHRKGLKRYLETGEGPVLEQRLELPAIKRDGTEFPIEVGIFAHPDATPPMFTGFIRDLTEVKRTERELERLVAERTRELTEVNQELEAFSYSVAHDLRAPLRSIDGFSQALLEDWSDKLDEQGQTYLRHVRESAQEMGQLIDDLLTLSRIVRSELKPVKVDLSLLAKETIEELRRADPDRRVEVVVQEGLEVRADRRLLRVLVGNLLGNAWKFTGKAPAGRIELGAEPGGPPLTCYVRDNGAGFDMSYADKLFKVFQRLHSAHEFEGTGIGLATVQRIVRRHGGHIRAEGEIDRGATFYFTLERTSQP